MNRARAAVALTVPSLLATPAVADAYNTQNWYTSSVPPPNFLAPGSPHLITGGLWGDVGRPTGDYCNAYGMPALDQKIQADQSPITGYQPPPPNFDAYQTGSGGANLDVCQAGPAGTVGIWGAEIHSHANGGAYCSGGNTCGMAHFASLQSSDVRPFSPSFGPSPSLEIKSTFKVHTYTPAGQDGGWAYVCALMRDATTQNGVEYCLEEWQPMTTNPNWPMHEDPMWQPSCHQYVDPVHQYSIVHTNFKSSGTAYATMESGSHQTVIGQNGNFNFAAAISRSQFQLAMQRVNSECNNPVSTNPSDWQLLGIEDGAEFWGGIGSFGATHGTLTVNTIF